MPVAAVEDEGLGQLETEVYLADARRRLGVQDVEAARAACRCGRDS